MNLKLKPEYAYTCASESTERDVSVEHSEAHGQDKVNNLSNGSTDRDESMEQSHTLGHDEDNTHFEERANDEWKYGDMNEEEFEDVKPEAYTGGQTILFADPDVIDRFIRHNVPSTCTAQVSMKQHFLTLFTSHLENNTLTKVEYNFHLKRTCTH
jgi:hypothetical protein